jgi:hypothetical protein
MGAGIVTGIFEKAGCLLVGGCRIALAEFDAA